MIDGYCFPRSAVPGGSLPLHVSTDAATFDVEIVREGATRDVVWRAEGVRGQSHPTPDDAAVNGCGWPAALEIPIGEDWRSGYYAVTLTAGEERADAFLVVRPGPGTPRAPMILVLATTTWNAYNDWGGPSLYTGGTQVSFERPLARGFLDKPEPMRRKMQPEPDREALWYFEWAEPLGLSVWSGGAGWATWERDFVRWAESSGYELDVATSEDLEQHPEVLDGHRLFLSVGHDEYWSRGMRETLDAFTDAGGNAAIFSGNTCFWQVRFDEGVRSMTGFKYKADEDPVVGTPEEHLVTGPWSDRRIGWPETRTIGLTFTHGGYSRYGLGVPAGSGAYTVWRPEHWAFEGTDLRYGDELGRADAIVAYEVDGVELTVRRRPAGPDRSRRRARRARDPGHRPGAPLEPARAAEPVRARARRAREHRDGRLRTWVARPGASRGEQPRVHRGVHETWWRHRVQRRRHRLDVRPRRSSRRPSHEERARPPVELTVRSGYAS